MSNYKLNEKMNKKLIFVVVVMLGMALQGMAQEPFTVTKFPFRKFVRLNDGVNLRQSPSANSPRLVSRLNELDGTEFVWLDRPLKKGEQAARVTASVVLEPSLMPSFMPKVKVADGWLCGYYEGEYVYFMEKFCKPVSMRPLSVDEYLNFSDVDDLVVVKSGKYKNYCVTKSTGLGDWYLSLGKYVDGVFVFENTIFFRSSTAKESLYEDGRFYYGTKIADEAGELDLQKLVRDQNSMDILMKKAISDSDEYGYVNFLYGIEGDKNVYSVTLSEKTTIDE